MQLNAAVDDIAALAEANAKLVAAAKSRGTTLSVEDRRCAQSLVRNVVVSLVQCSHFGFKQGTVLHHHAHTLEPPS